MIAYPGMIPEEGQAADSEHDAQDLPMVFVTRDKAAAYCEWAGMRLPSAAEWKEAAKNSRITEYTAENANCIGTDRAGLLKSADQVSLTVPVTAFEASAYDTGLV